MSDVPPQSSDGPPDDPEPDPEPDLEPNSGKGERRSIDPLDLVMIAAGLAAYVFSFVVFYQISVAGVTDHFDAWQDVGGRGFVGSFGTVLALFGALLVAVSMAGSRAHVPVIVVLAVFAAALILLFVSIFLNPLNGALDGACAGDTTGECDQLLSTATIAHGIGFWVAFGLTIIATGLAGLKFAMERELI